MKDGPRRRLPWPELLVATLVLVAGVSVYLYAHRDEGALAQSKRAGGEIVVALTSYRNETGEYPATLAALVPEYLDSVPLPDWGLGVWAYERYAAKGDTTYFQLSVAAAPGGYPLLYFDPVSRRWVLNN